MMIDLTCDFHTHILPNIDDGAESMQKSLRLLHRASSVGIKTVCLTPHFYAHRRSVDFFVTRRNNAYARLCEALGDDRDAPRLLLGAEILVFPGLENMDGLDRLTLEGTNTLLLELPLSKDLITDEHLLTVEALCRRYEVVIAHANRYADDIIETCIESGALLQLNADDVCSITARRRVRYWLQSGAVTALGSDAHRSLSVYGKFKKARKILSK